jgi:type IX secretion system PorP/SprF family membrane protein
MRGSQRIYMLMLILLPAISRGQDPHFTQFFASPMTLNPAYTGFFNGDLRIAGNYRSQWSSISTPFITGTVSADMDILKNIINPNDVFGIGIMALYDQTGGGGLVENYVGISTAYHKSLDVYGDQTLGLGAQVTLVQKRLDFSRLIFEDQLGTEGFDPNISSGENFTNTNITYSDYNVGLLYNATIHDNSNLYVGASYYHITQPNESFLGETNRINARISIHGGGAFPINATTKFYTSGLFMQQGGAREIDFGGAFGLTVDNDPDLPTIFYVGSWYRWNDAINPYVGLETKGFKVGLSYDVNVSSLSTASQFRGGIEISVIYIKPASTPGRKHLTCPEF